MRMHARARPIFPPHIFPVYCPSADNAWRGEKRMIRLPRLLALCCCALAFAADTTQPAKPVCNIIDFGAISDGKTLNTAAIQKAIDTCNAAGGGRVIVPAGTFLTAPINLCSNLDFHLEAGATLLFSPNRSDYPLVPSSWEGRDTLLCEAPITGNNLHDISITGPGTIDGNGQIWRPVRRMKMTDAQWNALVKSGGEVGTLYVASPSEAPPPDEDRTTWYPSEIARTGGRALAALRAKPGPPNPDDYAKFRDLLRPNLVFLKNCQHILLDGPTFRNSGSWNVHILLGDQIEIRHITIFNEIYVQNGDGIDIDSCNHVLIEKDDIHAGDDNICLKAGRDPNSAQHNPPTQNVVIRDCKIGWGHGISLGSETSGGIRNVLIYNLTMDGTDFGLRFKTTRGRGGTVENIHADHITMTGITKTAILFDMYYMERRPKPEPVSNRTPIFRDITLSDITCDGAKDALQVRGLPELPMSDITLKNIRITSKNGATIDQVNGFTLDNVSIHSAVAPAFLAQNTRNLVTKNLDAVVVPGPATAPAQETHP
jgi:polygalacturonase